MIKTPYLFEENLSDQDYQKIGQFTLRWSHMEHTIGNCLRRLLDMSPENATVLIFPLSLDQRISHIDRFSKLKPLNPMPAALFGELKPLIRAMQYIRNSAVHGIIIDARDDEEPYFELRSKGRKITKKQLFGCEDLINYTAHVVTAFRLSLGGKGSSWGGDAGSHVYTLPARPQIPEFFPQDCRAFPKQDMLTRETASSK